MAKKGAMNSGTGGANRRTADQSMAQHLPPSPKTWNKRPDLPPFHANKGTVHRRPGQRRLRDA